MTIDITYIGYACIRLKNVNIFIGSIFSQKIWANFQILVHFIEKPPPLLPPTCHQTVKKVARATTCWSRCVTQIQTI